MLHLLPDLIAKVQESARADEAAAKAKWELAGELKKFVPSDDPRQKNDLYRSR
jgi:hypothetical protein